MTTTSSRWPWIAPILLYAVSALEMIIMISPAAAYFYSVYTPLFHGLEQFSATAWLPQFFLPHLAHTQWPLFRALNLIGAALTLLGLVGFLVCAVQLYYGKFVRKQLVSGGLYGRVRHPQYLCLAVAGAGLLMLWPRFFILATYLLMLGFYYALARHEEELVRKRYGQPAEAYMARVPMFNPFRGTADTAECRPPAPARALTVWAVTVVAGLGLAFLLRSVAVDQLYVVRMESPPLTAVALRSRPEAEIRALAETVLASTPLQSRAAGAADAPLFLQIGTGTGLLKHLLIDLGMTTDSVDRLEYLDGAEFAVVSGVAPHDAAAGVSANPFALSTRIEPLFLAQRMPGAPDVTVTRLTSDQFHPRFSRILF
jgi:protein-S-isoprenylcysteine O-methyltransferase Ste14